MSLIRQPVGSICRAHDGARVAGRGTSDAAFKSMAKLQGLPTEDPAQVQRRAQQQQAELARIQHREHLVYLVPDANSPRPSFPKTRPVPPRLGPSSATLDEAAEAAVRDPQAARAFADLCHEVGRSVHTSFFAIDPGVSVECLSIANALALYVSKGDEVWAEGDDREALITLIQGLRRFAGSSEVDKPLKEGLWVTMTTLKPGENGPLTLTEPYFKQLNKIMGALARSIPPVGRGDLRRREFFDRGMLPDVRAATLKTAVQQLGLLIAFARRIGADPDREPGAGRLRELTRKLDADASRLGGALVSEAPGDVSALIESFVERLGEFLHLFEAVPRHLRGESPKALCQLALDADALLQSNAKK